MRWLIRTVTALLLVACAVASAPLIQSGRGHTLVPLIPGVIGMVAGLVLTERSFDNLSESGKRRPLLVLMRGGRARREDFTELGWRYREWSYRVSVTGLLLASVLLVCA